MERVCQHVLCIAYKRDKIQRIYVVKRIVCKSLVAFNVFVEIGQLYNFQMGDSGEFFGPSALLGVVA